MRLKGVLAGAGLLTLGAGCAVPGHYEGGSFYSSDKHVYVSRAHMPVTVEVVDSRTEEAVWSLDVPVGQKLVIQFAKGKYRKENPAFPDRMKWGLLRGDRTFGPLPDENVVAVPPADARRLRPTYRAAPEYPPGAEARAANGSAPPAN